VYIQGLPGQGRLGTRPKDRGLVGFCWNVRYKFSSSFNCFKTTSHLLLERCCHQEARGQAAAVAGTASAGSAAPRLPWRGGRPQPRLGTHAAHTGSSPHAPPQPPRPWSSAPAGGGRRAVFYQLGVLSTAHRSSPLRALEENNG